MASRSWKFRARNCPVKASTNELELQRVIAQLPRIGSNKMLGERGTEYSQSRPCHFGAMRDLSTHSESHNIWSRV